MRMPIAAKMIVLNMAVIIRLPVIVALLGATVRAIIGRCQMLGYLFLVVSRVMWFMIDAKVALFRGIGRSAWGYLYFYHLRTPLFLPTEGKCECR